MRKIKILNSYLLLVLFGTFFPHSPTLAISEAQKNAIVSNCNVIKENLSNIQKKDSRTRVYLGGHFETILSKYLKPLNHRLIENDISNVEIINEQSAFFNTKTAFSTDFVTYQKTLDNLIATDCQSEPEVFYDKLVATRAARADVLEDVDELKKFILENISSVQLLEEEI